MAIAFMVERLVMLYVLLFRSYGTTTGGLDLAVLFLSFSNGIYFGTYFGGVSTEGQDSKNNHKETEKGDNRNISKEWAAYNKAKVEFGLRVEAFIFWTERLVMFFLFCIWRSGSNEGLDFTVVFFFFSNAVYFMLAAGNPDSQNKHKETGKGDIGNISKESREKKASTDIKLKDEKVIEGQGNQKIGGGDCSCQEEEKKVKDKRNEELERTCSTVASDHVKDLNTTKEEETQKLKARLEELQMKLAREEISILKISYDEAGKKSELEASRNKYKEDYRNKLKEKKEKWAKKLKQATEKYEEDCGKWEEERCNVAAMLYAATVSAQVYQNLLQDSKENGRRLEEEKSNLTSQLCAATEQSELYRAILRDPCS